MLPVLQQKINFWKVGMNLLEKHLIYNSDPLLCFDNNTAASNYWEFKYVVTFWNLFLVCNPVKISKGKFMNCHIFETKGRRKLKFGVSLQICQIFWEKTELKFFRPKCTFNNSFFHWPTKEDLRCAILVVSDGAYISMTSFEGCRQGGRKKNILARASKFLSPPTLPDYYF